MTGVSPPGELGTRWFQISVEEMSTGHLSLYWSMPSGIFGLSNIEVYSHTLGDLDLLYANRIELLCFLSRATSQSISNIVKYLEAYKPPLEQLAEVFDEDV